MSAVVRFMPLGSTSGIVRPWSFLTWKKWLVTDAFTSTMFTTMDAADCRMYVLWKDAARRCRLYSGLIMALSSRGFHSLLYVTTETITGTVASRYQFTFYHHI